MTTQASDRMQRVLMLPPFYYKGVTEEGLYRHFSEVIQRVGDAKLKIYLYHIPPIAVVGITPGLVERLLKAYPNAIAGMKDSSGDWNNTKTFLDAFAKSGSTCSRLESFLLQGLRNGGVARSRDCDVNPRDQISHGLENADAVAAGCLNRPRDASKTYLLCALKRHRDLPKRPGGPPCVAARRAHREGEVARSEIEAIASRCRLEAPWPSGRG